MKKNQFLPVLIGIVWMAWIWPFRVPDQNQEGVKTTFHAASHASLNWFEDLFTEPEQEDDLQDFYAEPFLKDEPIVRRTFFTGKWMNPSGIVSLKTDPPKIYILIQKLLI